MTCLTIFRCGNIVIAFYTFFFAKNNFYILFSHRRQEHLCPNNNFAPTLNPELGIRGEMNDRRKRLIGMAFSRLDQDGSGTVDVDEIVTQYDFTWHPDVKAGERGMLCV